MSAGKQSTSGGGGSGGVSRISYPRRYINAHGVDELRSTVQRLRRTAADGTTDKGDTERGSSHALMRYSSVNADSPLSLVVEGSLPPPPAGGQLAFGAPARLASSTASFSILNPAGAQDGDKPQESPVVDESIVVELSNESEVREIVRSVAVAIHELHVHHRMPHAHLSRDSVILQRLKSNNSVAAQPGQDTTAAGGGGSKPDQVIGRKKFQVIVTDHAIPPSLFVKNSRPWKQWMRVAAPEVRAMQPYGYAADVWGIAAFMMDLVSMTFETSAAEKKKSSPLTAGSQSTTNLVLDDMLDTDMLLEGGLLLPQLNSLSPAAMSFVMPCLKVDPGQRPALHQLLEHPFLNPQVDRPATSQRYVDNQNMGGGRLGHFLAASESDESASSSDEDEEEDEEEEEQEEEEEEEGEEEEEA